MISSCRSQKVRSFTHSARQIFPSSPRNSDRLHDRARLAVLHYQASPIDLKATVVPIAIYPILPSWDWLPSPTHVHCGFRPRLANHGLIPAVYSRISMFYSPALLSFGDNRPSNLLPKSLYNLRKSYFATKLSCAPDIKVLGVVIKCV